MIERDVLFEVLDALEALGIPYMIVGSFASTYWGRPRTTHDADIVVEMPPSKARPLARSLDVDFYAPEPVIREAVRRRGQFNVIHLNHPFKVDLWLRQDTPYDRERFGRRREATLLGRRVYVSAAEDVILIKLVWHRTSPALHRQFQDALEVYEIQGPNLDQAYLDRWAGVLDVVDILRQVRAEAAGPPEPQGDDV